MRKSLFLILGLVVIVVLLPLLTIMYMRRANTTPTYNQAIALLQRSGDAVIRSDPLTHTSTSIANLAFSCISLLEGSTQLQTVDPTRSQSFQTYGLSIANYLVTNDNLSPDGTIGWGLSNPFDAFSDGTVNPANTVYAFEDAMVGYCLLDAYTLTKNALYLKTVESAMSAYWTAGTSTVDAQCNNCWYFWYSLNANDVKRYVKNINVLMGIIAARLSALTGNSSYTQKAQQIYNAEKYEANTRKNTLYYGYDDPQYPNFSTNIEDGHLGYEVWSISDIANYLHLPVDERALNTERQALLNCGAPCDFSANDPIDSTALAATCITAQADKTSKSECQQYIQHKNSATKVGAWTLIGVAKALPVFASSG